MDQIKPHNVAVILCTFNGELFLAQQLESITKQTLLPQLYISDDGSTDNTLNIIQAFQAEHPELNIQLRKGPQKGFQYNFIHFLSSPHAPAPYIAFADQDDIWEPNKLERAVSMLSQLPPYQPGLYGSRTQLINEDGEHIGYSPLFSRPPTFANALTQNIAGGNTMVMNAAAWHKLHHMLPNAIVSHDWWMYQAISGIGGAIFYDTHPSVQYRQHKHNIIGSNLSLKASLKRFRWMLCNRFKEWNDIQLAALKPHVQMLTPENQSILELFMESRQKRLIPRLVCFFQSGVYRQSTLGMIGLWVSAILGKY